jgi:hypothetical protein
MFIAPVGIIAFPKLLPALSPGKRHCFKDILFPVPWSLPSYTRKMSEKLKSRKLFEEELLLALELPLVFSTNFLIGIDLSTGRKNTKSMFLSI